MQVPVPLRNETVGPDSEHAERLLKHFLEGEPDGHDLADTFHLRSYLELRVLELVNVPARHFEDEIVERRVEARGRRSCDGILEFRQRVAESEFRRDERKRVAGRFRSQGRRARKARVHFDNPIVARFGIKRVLDVALADDAQMTNGFYRYFTKPVILFVR